MLNAGVFYFELIDAIVGLDMYMAPLNCFKLLKATLDSLNYAMCAVNIDGLWYCNINLEDLFVPTTGVADKAVDGLNKNCAGKFV